MIVDKEQFHNNNENITLQGDVISQNKIDEINNKSKDNSAFYTLPENYGQQFTHHTIANNNNYGINNGYGNMFYGY